MEFEWLDFRQFFRKPLAYLQKASSLLTPDELHEKSCDTLRLQQEFWEIPMNHPSEKDFNVPGHGTKNRYRTILPSKFLFILAIKVALKLLRYIEIVFI